MPHMGRVAAFLLTSALASAQSRISSGDLHGFVTDPAGAAIENAAITVTDDERGWKRELRSEAGGEYWVRALPPGMYAVRIEAAGFTPSRVTSVEVRVGDTVVLRTRLEVGSVATELTVTADVAVIEPERTQQAATIESRRIRDLPINRRNYLDFALLTPGVVETNDIVDGSDFRVVQAPQSGLSFGGGNGRGNMFTIDGVENYLSSGGVRPSVSQEVVREFQINRNTFSAEFGGAQGGLVNIVTRSGHNDFHGNFFGFLRHRDIQARNYFDPGKSAYTRGQYGATVHGPIVRNRTFFYAGFERLDRHETAFVPILQDRSAFGRLTPSQQQLADFFDAAPVPQLRVFGPALRQNLITNNFPGTLALFNRNSGNFPFDEMNNQFSIRLDHGFSQRSQAFLRANFTKSHNENAQFGALIAYNRGRSIDQTDGTVALGHTFIFSPRWVAESRAMFNYNNLDVIPLDRLGPEMNISGFGSFGREIFLPSTSFERHFQFQQNFSFSSGRHNLKFGADINPVRITLRSETFFSGRFTFGEAIPLGNLLPLLTGNPNATTELAATFNALGQQRLIPNLSAPITALQSFNLGLPIVYQQGFGDPNWLAWFRRYNLFFQDSWRIRPNFTLDLGVRYELEDPPDIVRFDRNNVGPRVGFAWTPFQDGKLVIRGGYGIFYAQNNAQVANLPETLDGERISQAFISVRGIPGLNNPLTGQPLTSFDIWRGLAARGVIGNRPITREDIAPFGLRPGPRAPGRVIFGIVPDFANPYAQQASFEVERALGEWTVSAAYNFNRGARIVRNLDRNLFYRGRTPDDQPVFGFFDPTILQYNVLESTANSFYHAGILQVNRRFSRNLAVNAHYTWAKAIDEVTDFNSDWQPHDQLNARAERARSSFDQAHRVVANAVLQSPWENAALRGFTASPIFIANSGRPFNVLAGFDNLGDNHPSTHRPFGAGRNIGRGPAFFTIDARVSRRFALSKDGARNLEFIAEGFNLLNRTNFKTLNNTVGNVRLRDLPSPLVGRRGAPIDPLSFTSTFDPRQFQFGLKINW